MFWQILAYGLASVFVASGLAKLARFSDFVEAVGGYAVLPSAAVGVVAGTVPFVELALGLWLISGLAIRSAAATAAALLCAFTSAAGLALVRGHHGDCGCFGLARQSALSWRILARNLVLIAAALALAVGVSDGLTARLSGSHQTTALALPAAVVTTGGFLIGLLVTWASRVRRSLRTGGSL